MKIVIDIPERDYDLACNYPNALIATYAHYIKDGTPYEERPQSKWIPVSVQEPDVGGMYLVTGKDVSGHIGIDIARRISVDVWTFGGEELSGVEIIAWQPTPNPYKEAENE